MSPANHAVRRSFCPQTTPNLTFQLVLNLGKDQSVIVSQKGRSWKIDGGFRDKNRDIAILMVKKLGLPPAKFNGGIPTEGERIYAIGSPEGLESTISDGIVSGIRTIGDDLFFQVSTPISPGSSGGGLFNSKGELIGLTTFKVKGENLNFAIPIAYAIGIPKEDQIWLTKNTLKSDAVKPIDAGSLQLSLSELNDFHMVNKDQIFPGYQKIELSANGRILSLYHKVTYPKFDPVYGPSKTEFKERIMKIQIPMAMMQAKRKYIKSDQFNGYVVVLKNIENVPCIKIIDQDDYVPPVEIDGISFATYDPKACQDLLAIFNTIIQSTGGKLKDSDDLPITDPTQESINAQIAASKSRLTILDEGIQKSKQDARNFINNVNARYSDQKTRNGILASHWRQINQSSEYIALQSSGDKFMYFMPFFDFALNSRKIAKAIYLENSNGLKDIGLTNAIIAKQQ